MKRYTFLFLGLICFATLAAQSGDSRGIVGVWKSPDNSYMIKIDLVGDHFQGRVVWLSTSDQDGILLDTQNPNAQMRNMPIKGNKIIQGITFNPQKSRWEGGTFYNYTEGKLYKCQITQNSTNQIKITKFTHDQEDGRVETWLRQ